MKLWQLQAVVIAFLFAVGFTVANLPRLYKPRPNAMCKAPADEMARRACADLSAGPGAR